MLLQRVPRFYDYMYLLFQINQFEERDNEVFKDYMKKSVDFVPLISIYKIPHMDFNFLHYLLGDAITIRYVQKNHANEHIIKSSFAEGIIKLHLKR